jgi:hypothetical protein
MKSILTFTFLLIVCMESNGQNDCLEYFSDYTEMSRQFRMFYQEQNYPDAAMIIENHLDRFPDHLEANAFNLAIVYGHIGNVASGIEVLNIAHDKGIWFNI